MKKAFLLTSFLTYTFFCSAQINTIKVPTDNKLETALDSLVDQSALAFFKNNSRVGVSIGIIKDGKSFIFNYGSTQKEKPQLPTGVI